MAQEIYIKEYNGNILGIIRTESNGDQTAIDYRTQKIVGYYRALFDTTTDPSGRVIARGNCVTALIYGNRT